MEKNYKLIECETLNNFIYKNSGVDSLIKDLLYNDFIGETQDIDSLVKELWYKDLYISIYKYSFEELNNNSTYNKFIEVATKTYFRQNQLNKNLKISDGAYDRFLIGCVMGEIYNRFSESNALKYKSQGIFLNDLIDSVRKHTNLSKIDPIETTKVKKLTHNLY